MDGMHEPAPGRNSTDPDPVSHGRPGYPILSGPASTFLSAPLAGDYLAAPASAEHVHRGMGGSVMPEPQNSSLGRSPVDGNSLGGGPALQLPPFASGGQPVSGRQGETHLQWPLHSFLELGALEGAVPSARLHARHVLREWGVADLGESTELVVSELVTNGVKASRAMTQAAIRLWLYSDHEQVAVMVWDASSQPPVLMDVHDDAENGRGLMLVDAVSEQWGWCYPGETSNANHHGKLVWAVIGPR